MTVYLARSVVLNALEVRAWHRPVDGVCVSCGVPWRCTAGTTAIRILIAARQRACELVEFDGAASRPAAREWMERVNWTATTREFMWVR